MTRESVPSYERRQVNYENVAMEFDGDSHHMVERTERGYEPVDQ